MIQCKGCDQEFEPRRKWQVFHSNSCRQEYWRRMFREALKVVQERAS